MRPLRFLHRHEQEAALEAKFRHHSNRAERILRYATGLYGPVEFPEAEFLAAHLIGARVRLHDGEREFALFQAMLVHYIALTYLIDRSLPPRVLADREARQRRHAEILDRWPVI